MLPEHRALLEDELCPVADEILGEMYRASAHGLNELIATVSPTARVLLAVYCYRRAHLASIGFAIRLPAIKTILPTGVATQVRSCSNDRGKLRHRCPVITVQLAGGKLHWRRATPLMRATLRRHGLNPADAARPAPMR